MLRTLSRRTFSTRSSSTFMITTPIFYVNASPHIGHAFSAVLADARARWAGLSTSPPPLVHFLTGTDEHGLKVQQAAARAQLPPKDFCDQVSSRFRQSFARLHVHCTDFLRTSEPRHARAVHALWTQLRTRDLIYLGDYSGWYSIPDEAFLTPTQTEWQLDGNPLPSTPSPSPSSPSSSPSTASPPTPPVPGAVRVSKESGHVVDWITEPNYKFRLSAFQQPLLKWLRDHPHVIYPRVRYEQVVEMVEAGLHDLSVSRLAETIDWALRVPGHDEHSIYVWLDALTNYLTSTGYPDAMGAWPADVQIVGKDILRFHAVYWPAFLMAAGLPLPRQIVAHGFWKEGNRKMSKSLGNVISPDDLVQRLDGSADAVRLFLLAHGALDQDNTFSERELIRSTNAILANSLGNLLQRCTTKRFLAAGQTIPAMPPQREWSSAQQDLAEALNALAPTVAPLYDALDFRGGIEHLRVFLSQVNTFWNDEAPWATKDNHTTVALTLEALRVAGILLQPITPQLADDLLTRLGVPKSERLATHCTLQSRSGTPLQPFPDGRRMLIQRFEEDDDQ